MALAPLANTLWVDAAGPAGPGLPLQNSGAGAFATVQTAIAALAAGAARLFVVQGDYSSGGVPLDTGVHELSIEGVGGFATGAANPAALPPLENAAASVLFLRNVQVTPDGAFSSLAGYLNAFVIDSSIVGNVTLAGSLQAYGSLFGGAIVSPDSPAFRDCDASGPITIDSNLPRIDLASFVNFGNRGVTRIDGVTADWLLSTPSAATEQRYAAFQNADRTVAMPAYVGVWVSRNSLNVNRSLTVDVSAATELQLFHAYNFGQAGTGAAFDVNTIVVPDFSHAVFQVQTGALVLISLEAMV